ncbi:hypothetical protein SAMN00017477_1469 [Peptoniphilus asaccharolyticus DSM 20463]|uniref:UPF0246 protein SAMN00017477_1469 n=1 Tax=Peptoniphilus asaccharolyticus DSM 20463 TaxID=573058 RepID=A0A1W1V6B7_PEPAS|nr:peroxide stress protein YaaA [Peptoniphilus asaccharolyticus]MBL7575992.1 peroxide stress protein YaaA [Peptoniphilus asaccharolyticus]MBL7576006.1 peroxide stress protein YaaA [Peptoniphilus asaccharolyticus]MBL7576407.1 peroxide stress protein YaaA [Peptoniphilus asaccharolyticus]SMB88816.1 hypothetical protein SAMN00017477_1469 [Peptoniphilus asaccharolyticus DSM 20463]
MHIILSPTKKMKYVDGQEMSKSKLIDKTTEILKELQNKSYTELKDIWKCNDKLAEQNYQRIKNMFEQRPTPALFAYDGIVFKNIAPETLEKEEIDYLTDHLRILSGFYGVLKPLDGVVPYRLEMQAEISIADKKNLYEYWADTIYKELKAPIVNLASKEYTKVVEPYIQNGEMVTCSFYEIVSGKPVQKATYSKMARGEMVRYLAENKVQTVEEIKNFDRNGYIFNPETSTETEYNFYR